MTKTKQRMVIGLLTVAVLAVVGMIGYEAHAQSVANREASGVWSRAYQDQSVSVGRQVHYVIADYDFNRQGGTIGDIDLGVDIPDNAIVMQVVVDAIESTLPNTSTVALYTQTAADLYAASTNTTVVGMYAGVPVDTVGTAIKITADRNVYATVAVADVTSGVFRVIIKCYQSYD